MPATVYVVEIVAKPQGDSQACGLFHIRRHRTTSVPGFVVTQLDGSLGHDVAALSARRGLSNPHAGITRPLSSVLTTVLVQILAGRYGSSGHRIECDTGESGHRDRAPRSHPACETHPPSARISFMMVSIWAPPWIG
jgi:hypothetical protein